MSIYYLKLREEDILEIYEGQIHFNFLDKGHRDRLFLFALFFIGGLACYFFDPGNRSNFLMMILLFTICGYQADEIFKIYSSKRKSHNGILKWIEGIKGYKIHRLVIEGGVLRYERDADLFVYKLNDIKKIYHTPVYFYLVLQDGSDLLVPAKSMEEGKYEEFTNAVDEIVKDKQQ
jgi:hypothetical protein